MDTVVDSALEGVAGLSPAGDSAPGSGSDSGSCSGHFVGSGGALKGEYLLRPRLVV